MIEMKIKHGIFNREICSLQKIDEAGPILELGGGLEQGIRSRREEEYDLRTEKGRSSYGRHRNTSDRKSVV